MRPVLSWLVGASELVLPRACGGCGRASTWWCDRCARALDGPVRTATLAAGLDVALAAPYRGPVGAAVVAWKEQGVVALAAPLSAALVRAVRTVADHGCVLVPAPSRPAAVRRRGADVVAALADSAAARLVEQRPPVVRALRHGRRVVDQAGLDPELRALNLAGALRVRAAALPLLEGRTVVLVDDVLTTGATLAEAARAVRQACPAASRVVGAAVAAAGPFGPLFPDGGTG